MTKTVERQTIIMTLKASRFSIGIAAVKTKNFIEIFFVEKTKITLSSFCSYPINTFVVSKNSFITMTLDQL